jgi:hypothetical protein
MARLQFIQHRNPLHVTIGLLALTLCGGVALYAAQHAALLKLAYPAAAFAMGGWLYATRPALYLGFVWWTWLTVPFIRRLIEYQTGFDSMNLAMTAPLAASLFTVFSVLRFGKKLQERTYAPYAFLLAAIVYGYLVGLPKTSPLGATLVLLAWMLPVALAFHLHVLWNHYPAHRKAVQTVMRWGVLVLGVYGILQYLAPAPWDQAWMLASGMETIGRPEPYEVRVFSMLNAPGPFAMVMMAGLIVLFVDGQWMARLAVAPGAVALMLALVRAAWGGWAVGLGYLAVRSHGALQRRILVVLGVGLVLIVPFLQYGPIAEDVGDRAETLTALGQDNSFGDRVAFFKVAAGWVLSNPVGAGLGSTGRGAKLNDSGLVSFDSGILAIPFTLGWLGALLYISGLVLLLIPLLKVDARTLDPFALACAAVVVAFLAQLLFANSFTDLKGIVFWTFVGLGLAARLHHAAAAPVDPPQKAVAAS